MLLREYFFAACNADAYKYREWVINCFNAGGVLTSKEERDKADIKYPYQLYRDEGSVYFIKPDGGSEQLDDYPADGAMFAFKDRVTLAANEMPNQRAPVETCYGECYINYLIRIYPFGTMLDFIPGKVKTTTILKKILPIMQDNPEDGNFEDGVIYVKNFLLYVDAVMTLMGLVPLAVPSATPRTVTTNPEILKVRDRLLEENKDRLHDPAVIAGIDKQLTTLDREWIEGDPEKGFYIKNKSFDVARKRMFLFHGAEAGFSTDGSIDVVVNSLSEGWDLSKLPAMANSVREGSFSRGAETALGGEAVKFFQRVLQNASITVDDCGTNLGFPTHITKENLELYVGLYIQTGTGWQSYDTEGIQQFVGKEVLVRSPQFCQAPETDFCKKCMGDKLSLSPNSLASSASEVGSVFLNAFLKKMHGTALILAKYDYKSSLS
jgi:hypothetical protein